MPAPSRILIDLFKSAVMPSISLGIPGRELFSQFKPSIPGLKYWHVARGLAEARREARALGLGTTPVAETVIPKEIILKRHWPGPSKFRYLLRFQLRDLAGRIQPGYRYKWIEGRKLSRMGQTWARARNKYITRAGYWKTSPGASSTNYKVRSVALVRVEENVPIEEEGVFGGS